MFSYMKEFINNIKLFQKRPQLTALRLTPASLAPRHNPVDIPPQPEYKSNKAMSDLCGLWPEKFQKLGLSPFVWIFFMLSHDDSPGSSITTK